VTSRARERRTKVLAGFAAAAAIAVVTSAAWAVIPDAEGTINACFARDGYLRVIDTDAGQTCRSKEQALAWSSSPGELPDVFVTIRDVSVPPTQGFTQVATMELPAGNYQVTARAATSALDNDSAEVLCSLIPSDDELTPEESPLSDTAGLHLAPVGQPGSKGVITLLATQELSQPGTVDVACHASGNVSGARVSVVLRAVGVGSITTDPGPLTPSP
jgi:hypothetical protein